MKYQKLVHWHEGLFLQPHHLQSMQNSLLEQHRLDRNLFSYYPYGVIDIDIAENALENYIVKINSITAIMPSGIEVNVPSNAEVPPLNIKEHVDENREMVTVYLAVPIWSKNEANTLEKGDESINNKYLYSVAENEFNDENTGDNMQAVLMRKINARLITDHDNLTDMEVIPILQIKPVSEDAVETKLLIHKGFIPPCFSISGSSELMKMLADFHDQLRAFREELVISLNRSGYNPELLSGLVLEKILQLKAVNVYTARLGCLIKKEFTAPYLLYLELRSLLGEIAALQPIRDLYDVPEYDHDNCYPIFVEILSRVRNLISIDTTGSYITLDFEAAPEGGYYFAELTDEHIVKAEDYFLAVETRESPQQVISTIETGDHFKLIAKSTVGARIRGVKLKEERYPPPVLPAKHNVIWFRLKRSESTRCWNQIRDEKAIAAAWSEELLPQLKISLYITIFDKKDKA